MQGLKQYVIVSYMAEACKRYQQQQPSIFPLSGAGYMNQATP